MKRARFGRTELWVSELGLGCARIGGIFKSQPKQFLELLETAHDRGINFFDTADMYSQGESERLIGKAFSKQRERVIIASKVGYCLPARRKWLARIKPLLRPAIKAIGLKREHLSSAVRGEITQDFSPKYIRSAVEASLRRLQTDYLDLVQLHSPPTSVIERGDWLAALEQLKRAGKVRYYGVSCDTVDAARAALGFETVSSLQVAVSLLQRAFTQTVLPAAQGREIAVIARECLANGLLARAEGDIDASFSELAPEAAARRRDELALLRRSAAERGIHLSRLALEYVTGLGGVSVTLIGASRLDTLRETLREFGA